ncbi:MAG: 1-(5-phosphoribosyl)-5-[(5-phosphoribosylamino)methylideneamino]imidazole-4-carboxamide isomerase [Chloroflexi bacterium]|nr:1-(5-phosphoribosyl)-5-[(5-phosphoribosylamino)methylideneamino]imidazole-4-carboxamide isomerase [Chloroflexota bacterium]
MQIIPSIDLKSGRCVRLFQGDFQQETVFSEDPVKVALGWQEQGGAILHLVDLDGAAAGNPANLATIREIVDAVAMPIQVGGGIRGREIADALLSAGVSRVVIGTAAVNDPGLVEGLCRDYGSERVVVAVDARDGLVAIKGWTESSQVSALDLAHRMKELGVPRLLYTDVSRDGTLTSPNFAANEELVRETGMKVQASGGVSSLDHIRQLVSTGVEGAIIGTALYRGTISLGKAIRAGAA